MALINLLAVGWQDNIQNRAVRELIHIEPHFPIGWNKALSYTVPRNADVITKLNLQVKVGEAPNGYRWKRCWPLHFVKKLQLSIGGQILWETNTQALQMKYLIDGLKVSQDWTRVFRNAPIEMFRTPGECIFDYEESQRNQLSREPHEIFFEPLCLDELIQVDYKIPLVSLAFHEVSIRLETSSIEDCIEPIVGENLPELPVHLDTILDICNFAGLYTHLDTNERRVLAQGNIETQTKQYTHCAGIFEKPDEGRALRTSIQATMHSSAAYIWITDEAGNEIPSQVLHELTVLFDDQQREKLSGFQSRMAIRALLPHPTLPNTKSQNLYYISYYPGRTDENGFEQGMNFRRIESYKMHFTFTARAPQRLKINVVHRTQNTLLIKYGMAGLTFADEPTAIQLDQRVARVAPEPFAFENTDQVIDIPDDEKSCMITYKEFKENDIVQQCIPCKKIFDSEALDTWISTRFTKKCVHCQESYSARTFRKGKAHLTFLEEGEPNGDELPQGLHTG